MLRILLLTALVAALTWVAHDVSAQGPATPPRLDALGDPLPAGASARLGSTRFRHGGKQLLGFSQDGKMLLFHAPGAIHGMDAATGKFATVARYQEATLAAAQPRSSDAVAAVLSGNGKVLAYYDANARAFGIVDAVAVKELKRFQTDTLFDKQVQLNRVRYELSGDGKVLLVVAGDFGNNNNSIAWVDASTGKKMHALAAPKGGRWGNAQISYDGKHIAAVSDGDADGPRLRLYDTASGKEIRALPVDRPLDFAFLVRNDGKTLIGWTGRLGGGGGNNPVSLYDLTDDKQLKEIRKFVTLDNNGGAVLLSADGKQVFIRAGGRLTQWDVDNGQQIRAFDVGQDDINDPFGGRSVQAPVLSQDGKQLAVNNTKTVAVYSLATGALLTPATSGGGGVAQVRFAPDGQTLLATTFTQGTWIWDVKQAKVLRKLVAQGNAPRDFLGAFVGEVALSSDGKYAAQIPGVGAAEVWDTASGKHLHTLGEAKDFGAGFVQGSPVAFAAQGYTLATASSGGTVHLWDAATGKEVRQWVWQKIGIKDLERGDAGGLVALAFSPDGKTLAGAGFTGLDERRGVGTFLILWETATGRERMRLASPTIAGRDDLALILMIYDQFGMTLKFAPDGRTLVMGTYGSLHVIDTVHGKDVHTYSSRLCVGKTATFTKDGKLLILGRYDGSIRVLEAATGNIVRDVPAHEEGVQSLALSPDGKTLASGSADTTVLLWDMAELLKPVPVNKSAITAQQLEAWWKDLADPSGAKAYAAINQLAAAPAEAAPFLKGKLNPIAPVDPKVLDKLFTDLGSSKPEEQERANGELEKLGEQARAEVQKRLTGNPSPELRKRLEELLARLDGPVTSPELLQMFGAIEALGKMGTPEALQVLEAMAQGAPGHRVTEDARAALKRLKGL
jgi:WD40 repeat protein